MKAAKQGQILEDESRPACGQIALGVSGNWEVAVDETVTGPQRWIAQVDGPDASLTWELESPEVIEKAARLLGDMNLHGEVSAGSQTCGWELELGRLAGCGVCLVHDTESPQRCFLLIRSPDHGALRWTIAGQDFRDLTAAFAQAAAELVSPGPNVTEAELAGRAEEIRSGNAQGAPAEQVFAELRTKHS
ncbi:MAG TPA: hypothetical protein VML55_15380 [Planctomycetaceae bacterium]|nr:hypothetical protein [Planctomycetaceae bacterium]